MNGLWIITAICAAGAAVFGVAGVALANGAPQEASAAAIAVAVAVVPYCFTRACEKITDVQGRELKKLNETMTVHTKLLAQTANASAENAAHGG